MSKDLLSSDTRDPNFLSDFFNPSAEQLCTKSFNSFLQEYENHTKLFWFIVQLTSIVDRNRALAIKALAETERDPEKKKAYLEEIDDPSTTLKELQNHRHAVSQNLTNGIVNAFQRYFSSMITEICMKRP